MSSNVFLNQRLYKYVVQYYHIVDTYMVGLVMGPP